MTKTVAVPVELLEELLEAAKDGAAHKGEYLSKKYKEPELFAKFDAILAEPVPIAPRYFVSDQPNNLKCKTCGSFSAYHIAGRCPENVNVAYSDRSTPPLIQTLHDNGDRIALEATVKQQAEYIRLLETEKDKGRKE